MKESELDLYLDFEWGTRRKCNQSPETGTYKVYFALFEGWEEGVITIENEEADTIEIHGVEEIHSFAKLRQHLRRTLDSEYDRKIKDRVKICLGEL
jgi:hypothetical protein